MGLCFLTAMIVAYGIANFFQAAAASRVTLHRTLDPGLLVRLASHKSYLLGLFCQWLGFMLAFAARADLPLFLVQSSVAAGLGVTAVLGVLFLRWRLPRAEVALLVLLVVGIAGLVVAARPGQSRDLGPAGVAALVAALVAIAALGYFAVRLHGAPGSVALGALAGLAFSSAAIAARPLASVGTAEGFLTDPLLYLLLAHSIVGQLLLGLAMQRGSTTAAVAAMDAATAIPAAAVGLLLLGDRIEPGREWLAGVGFVVTLAAVLGLTRYAEPQHHQANPSQPAQRPALTPAHSIAALDRAPLDREPVGASRGRSPVPGDEP